MRTEPGVLALFVEPARAAGAVRALREAGHRDVRAAMPAAFPQVVKALGRPASRIGLITLAATAVGTLLGFALCIATSKSWPIVTAGKPIVSIPPFVVIAFELSVLVGSIANLTALAINSARARKRRAVPGDLGFARDRIGIFAAGGDRERSERILRSSGAEEVRRVD